MDASLCQRRYTIRGGFSARCYRKAGHLGAHHIYEPQLNLTLENIAGLRELVQRGSKPDDAEIIELLKGYGILLSMAARED